MPLPAKSEVFALPNYLGAMVPTQLRLKMKIFFLFLVALSLTLSDAPASSVSSIKKADVAKTDATSSGINFTADDYWFQGIKDKSEGEPEKAIKDFRKAVSLAPNDYMFHVSLANLLYTQNQLPQAVAEMRQIVRLKPTQTYWHLRLGNTLNLTGHRTQARKEWQKVILLDGDDGYGYEAKKMLKLFVA